MYGLKHHVEGEEGLPGNSQAGNSVRYTGRVLLAGALLAACLGFGGGFRHGSGFLELLCVVLLIGGAATLVYESDIQDRIGHWRR